MRQSARHNGFTTVELMVAGAVLAIVTVHVLATFSNQMATFNAQKRVADVQQDARLATEMILRDVRGAGFMVPRIAGIASGDGGAGAPDRLCTSDPSVISEASLDQALDRFDGAPLTATLGGAATTLNVSNLDIDGDTNPDFSVSRGVIISNGGVSHCARIISIAGTTIKFTPTTPVGFSVTALTGIAVPSIIYEITAGGIMRNTLLVSQQAEDLQLEFAVDNDGDGAIGGGEFPIHDLTGSDLSQIAAIQLSVLTRSDSEEVGFSGPGRQAIGNRAAGAPDSFRRRLVSVSAAPRNLQ
jgi:type II secretory pathway pseudopilin PulG